MQRQKHLGEIQLKVFRKYITKANANANAKGGHGGQGIQGGQVVMVKWSGRLMCYDGQGGPSGLDGSCGP